MEHRKVRKIWFDFWEEKGHDIMPSAPLVPINDDSLLWINAGVAPLKKYFDGSAIPNNKRMANIQKCIRTNDIENVGYTKRHATFFEMMGNFSVGDYFKKEAITWSWEFLTARLGLEKDRFCVTIYPGDEEAKQAWLDLGIEEDRIIELATNYWEIGTGPCGPDSEIFYDRGIEYDPENIGARLIQEEIENDRYIEVWNNVFSMYNAEEGKSREEYNELPSKNIDTGMGLERLLMVLQKADSIFETDVLYPLMQEIEKISNQKYQQQTPFRAIADHVRTVTFALADGASFGNVGRDYVLRRVIRRAVRFGRSIHIKEPFMHQLVDTVVSIMGDEYPNLKEKQNIIKGKIKQEEKLFAKTLEQGERKFNEILKNSKNKKITGPDAFKLYDTYGFPFELTKEMAELEGFSISEEEFLSYMEMQKEKARQARKVTTEMNLQNEALLNFKAKSDFVGYEKTKVQAQVVALFDGEKFVDSLKRGYLVLDKTPFYVESGGQIADQGFIITNNEKLKITASFKGPNKQHFHYVESEETININDQVSVEIDEEFRSQVSANHSAAHLLQNALQKVLSSSIEQAGSRIDDKTLRFDFIYEEKITDQELIKVEKEVNKQINKDDKTQTSLMNIDKALEQGVTAIFEDRYDKEVRVVNIGDSKELCGGTHVNNVQEIKKFAIATIETKGNNVYRIVATTKDRILDVLTDYAAGFRSGIVQQENKIKQLLKKAETEQVELFYQFRKHKTDLESYADIVALSQELEKLKNDTKK